MISPKIATMLMSKDVEMVRLGSLYLMETEPKMVWKDYLEGLNMYHIAYVEDRTIIVKERSPVEWWNRPTTMFVKDPTRIFKLIPKINTDE
jgi:hypothetical protein